MKRVVCNFRGCPNLIPHRSGGYCDSHKSAAPKRFSDRARGSASSRGYGTAWKRIRLIVLQEQPLCVLCEEEGRVSPATHVDHIVPKAAGGTDDRGNLRALCAPHHLAKTAREANEIRKGVYR